MLYDKKDNLILEAFTSDIMATTDENYYIYFPNNTEATFSIFGIYISEEGQYSHYFPDDSIAMSCDDVDIKIRQNFGKQFTFVTYLAVNGGIFHIGSYSPYTTSKMGELVLTTKSTPTEGFHSNTSDPYYGCTVCKVESYRMYMIVSTFNWNNSNSCFMIRHYLYNYLTRKQQGSTSGLSAYYVTDPMIISSYIPGLYLHCTDDDTVTFYGLRAYSCSLTNDEILECLNASIYFTKSSTQLRAKKFNEYCKYDGNVTIENDENTHPYTHTTFHKDGTVFCSGQLIEGAVNQVCKNGNIKSQEFIEY